MLPLWRNRICLAISPERISLVKLGRGLKPKLLAKYDEAISPASNSQPVKQPSWQAVLEKLTVILAQPELQHSDVDIVLSNRLVRYAVIPSNVQLKKYAEQEAFARHVLTHTYGSIIGQWQLRIQRGKAGLPWLVSAVDQALLDGLNQSCTSNKLKLRSVTPYLMPVFNRYRKALKFDPSWLVINEPGYSPFALLSGRVIVTISGASHDSINELNVMLDRENLVCTLPEPCKKVYLHAPVAGSLSVSAKAGYEYIKLESAVPEGFPPLTEGLYAMAMSGVL